MKTRIIIIICLFFTAHVSLAMESIGKLKNPDAVYITERCSANALAISIMGGKANNKSVQDGFKKIYTFFANTGIAIAMSNFPSLSERKISEQRMLNILSLEEIITKDMDKFYLQNGSAISGYIKEDMNICQELYRKSK